LPNNDELIPQETTTSIITTTIYTTPSTVSDNGLTPGAIGGIVGGLLGGFFVLGIVFLVIFRPHVSTGSRGQLVLPRYEQTSRESAGIRSQPLPQTGNSGHQDILGTSSDHRRSPEVENAGGRLGGTII